MEDVIGAVQTTVNQLNQFLLRATGQGVQLLQTAAGSAQQTLAFILGKTRTKSEQTNPRLSSLVTDHISEENHVPHKGTEEMCEEEMMGEETCLLVLELIIT